MDLKPLKRERKRFEGQLLLFNRMKECNVSWLQSLVAQFDQSCVIGLQSDDVLDVLKYQPK